MKVLLTLYGEERPARDFSPEEGAAEMAACQRRTRASHQHRPVDSRPISSWQRRSRSPCRPNGYAVQSSAYMLPFDARGAAEVIGVPVMMVHSEQALAPDLARAFYAAVTASKQELWLRSRGQIDFYDDPRLIAPATDAVAAFLRTG